MSNMVIVFHLQEQAMERLRREVRFFIFRAVAALLLIYPTITWGQASKEKSEQIPLASVIAVTESALDEYQKEAQPDPAKHCRSFPPLQSADFDFKTVVDNKAGATINLFIFTIGATTDKQQTTDIDFQYQPRAEVGTAPLGFTSPPKTLYQQLIDTLKAAAAEIAKAGATNSNESDGSFPQLDLKQVSISLSFGATTDVPVGLKVPFQLITVTGSLDKSKNNVQQVKLTFQNDKGTPLCAAGS